MQRRNAVHIRLLHAVDFGAQGSHHHAAGLVNVRGCAEALQDDLVVIAGTELASSQRDNEAQLLLSLNEGIFFRRQTKE